ncbi:hypothetical protein GIB67_011594 [Kingdonia uniflora]|uniref:Uncharacterized protein n=1 Tax=Kingdonia uniflora TaxID=39325 RepID=A0A7J7NLY2_9MAGN|nr:hypothetical protein GIB67_011594 [Kingdonia uniflora]
MNWLKILMQNSSPSLFFTEQLTAFEVWLDHGSEHKKLPEQLPILLQVLTFSKNLQFKGIYYCVYTKYLKTYTVYENIYQSLANENI